MMRLLFTIDSRDYNPNGKAVIRPSSRAIIIKNNQVAMIHSPKYHYYKFPGGGINEGETEIDALIRETLEESGLVIIPSSIEEYGYVHRINKGNKEGEDVFIQNNYYYLCDVEKDLKPQQLSGYELEEEFELVWVDPLTAITTNRTGNHNHKSKYMLFRESQGLEILIKEGLVSIENRK